jgi:ribosomal protein L22
MITLNEIERALAIASAANMTDTQRIVLIMCLINGKTFDEAKDIALSYE